MIYRVIASTLLSLFLLVGCEKESPSGGNGSGNQWNPNQVDSSVVMTATVNGQDLIFLDALDSELTQFNIAPVSAPPDPDHLFMLQGIEMNYIQNSLIDQHHIIFSFTGLDSADLQTGYVNEFNCMEYHYSDLSSATAVSATSCTSNSQLEFTDVNWDAMTVSGTFNGVLQEDSTSVKVVIENGEFYNVPIN